MWHLSLPWNARDTYEGSVTLVLIWQSLKNVFDAYLYLVLIYLWHSFFTWNSSATHLILRVLEQHNADDVHVDSVAKTGVAVYTGHLYRERKQIDNTDTMNKTSCLYDAIVCYFLLLLCLTFLNYKTINLVNM